METITPIDTAAAESVNTWETARSITYDRCADDLTTLTLKAARQGWGRARLLRAVATLAHTYDRYSTECNDVATAAISDDLADAE